MTVTPLEMQRNSGDSESSEDHVAFARHRLGRRFGAWVVNSPLVRDRVPARYRPALFYETFYNLGTGAFVTLFLTSSFVLKSVIDGTENHLALLAAMFGGSSLFSPIVSYCGRKFSMKSLVVYPNLLVASLLMATAIPIGGPLMFTIVVGSAFLVRVFPRVAEMNMYRILYPATHRGAAVGWIKAVSAVSALVVTLMGYWWFSYQPDRYWLLYGFVGLLLVFATMCYRQIPVSKTNFFAQNDGLTPYEAFWDGTKTFLSDRRFVFYQIGFLFAGFANHMAIVYVAQVLKEDVLATMTLEEMVPGVFRELVLVTWQLDRKTVEILIVGWIVAVFPVMLMMGSAPFWGRFLDRTNPMIGRCIFNTLQAVAYGFHAYGGLSLQIWPILVGSAIHAVANGGSTINWLTGSLYFAGSDRISLYNAVHVGLTGLRGLIAPLVGLYVYSSDGLGLGAGLFWVSVVLSLIGSVLMLWQGLTDSGSRESC